MRTPLLRKIKRKDSQLIIRNDVVKFFKFVDWNTSPKETFWNEDELKVASNDELLDLNSELQSLYTKENPSKWKLI